MKKYYGIVFCVIMLFSLVGCNKNTSSLANSKISSVSSSQQMNRSNSHLTLFKEGKIAFMLPNTYQKKSESPIIYVPSDYPQVSDNFNLVITQKDSNFKQITKEAYKKGLETELPSVDITEFKTLNISGYPAIKVNYSFTYNKVSMSSFQYLVDADKTYTFTYTCVNGDLKNYIEDSVSSISIKE